MFHRGACESRKGREHVENKSRTQAQIARDATAVNENGMVNPAGTLSQCSFIVTERWRFGGAEPFCNAPAVPGSAYCARHLAHCAAAPETELALAGEVEAPPPPPELRYLREAALPEVLPEAEDELRALLDVRPREPRGEE